jgi:glyoxylate carboligase
MTNILEFKQSGHLNPALADPSQNQLNGEKLIGRWVNTNRETKGIAQCVIARDGDHYNVRVQGVGEDGVIEWPMPIATPLANLEEEAGQRTVALAADFDFGFMRAETHIRINKGVLVIVLFVRFMDDSGRSNYLNREFFFRAD